MANEIQRTVCARVCRFPQINVDDPIASIRIIAIRRQQNTTR